MRVSVSLLSREKRNRIGVQSCKHENYQPVGAFKVRGGINLISQLSPDERARGVIAVSTGNHGQSVAYAARLFGVKARIVVPEGANPGKVAAMQAMGAEVIFHGAIYDDAQLHCEALVREHGYRYIHSGNEPLLIAGVATETLEMLEDEPALEVIIVPIGGGSGASGTCIVTRTLNPSIRVIGVQAEASPAAYESWQQGRLIETTNRTMAEGLATGRAFELPQEIMRQMLHEFMLLTTPPAEARGVLSGASTLPLSLCWREKAALVWLRSDFRADALRHGGCPCFGA